MIRIKTIQQDNGTYRSYLQTHMGRNVWYDSHYGWCGVGNSIDGAIVNLREEIRREISYIKTIIAESNKCDVVDEYGKFICRGRDDNTIAIEEFWNDVKAYTEYNGE